MTKRLLDLNREELKHYGSGQTRFEADCLSLGAELPSDYFEHLFQVSCWLIRQTRGKRFTLGVSGAQGSGKTTFAKLLANQLEQRVKGGVRVASLDDFYLGRQARLALAEKVHPLLETRGVPGTHDLGLLQAFKSAFLKGGRSLAPVFDKATDDRARVDYVNFEATQVLLFEGWCWGAEAVPVEELSEPVNELEAEEDNEGAWRRYVNAQLNAYQSLFETDFGIFLKVPSIGAIRRWRWQQEQALELGVHRLEQADIHRFVMHYERITRRLLNRQGADFDLLLELDEDHQITHLGTVKA